MFIWNSRHTHRYPVSEIVSIGPYQGSQTIDREMLATAEMKGGATVVIYQFDADKLVREEAFISAIPAAPGYSILRVCLDEDPPVIDRAPVVAWFATASGHLTPASVAGAWDEGSADVPVEGPDGRVWHAADQVDHSNAEEMLAYMVGERKRRSEMAARAASADRAEGPTS